MKVWLGRLCEEFHCLPSVAYREWLAAPAGFLEELLEARSYAHAKRTIEHAKTKDDIPPGEIFAWVQQIELEIAGEELAARLAALPPDDPAHG